MFSNIQDKLVEARKFALTYFNLRIPFAYVELKKAYRNASLVLHPDRGGTEEEFVRMKEAYDFLASLWGTSLGVFSESEINGLEMPLATVEGDILSELGLGLGPMVSGRDCEHCHHAGYTSFHGEHYKQCEPCSGTGRKPSNSRCLPCKGSGKFTQARSRRVVDCRKCKGSGIFRHPYLTTHCQDCLGGGLVFSKNKNQVFYRKCSPCKGSGEILIFNPVIPKGLLG